MNWCWHNWRVVEKVEQPSQAEIARDSGYVITADGNVARKALIRPYVVTYRCSRCDAEKVTRI